MPRPQKMFGCFDLMEWLRAGEESIEGDRIIGLSCVWMYGSKMRYPLVNAGFTFF